MLYTLVCSTKPEGRARIGRRYGSAVGYNPFRKQVKRSSDVWFLVSALVVAALLVVWAANPF